MKFCTECGSKLKGGEKFCSECGQQLGASGHAKDSTASKTVPPPAAEEARPLSESTPTPQEKRPWKKSLVTYLLKQFIIFMAILGPAYFLYENLQFFACTLWGLIGGCAVFYWQYRKSWVVNVFSTLAPMAGLFFLSYYQSGGFIDVAIYALGVSYQNSNELLYGALGLGLVLGLVLGVLTKLRCQGMFILAPALKWNVLLWAALCTASFTLGFTDWHPYLLCALFLLAFAQTANLFSLHFVLLLKRYIFSGPKLLRAATAALALSLALPLTQNPAHAQRFSEAERQEFRNVVTRKLRDSIGEYLRQRGWWRVWSTENAVNQNHMRTDAADRLFVQYALKLGTRDDSPTQSGHNFRIKMTKFTKEKFAENALANMANQQLVRRQANPGNKWVKAHTLGISGDSLKIEFSKPLPSGRDYSRVELMMSFGRWVIYLGDHSGGYAERGEALLRAIKHALSEIGERDGSATWAPEVPGIPVVQAARPATPPQLPARESLPAPDSTSAGHYSPTDGASAATPASSSSGSYYSPTGGDSVSTRSYSSHLRPNRTGRKSVEMAFVMLLSSALMGLGSVLTGGAGLGKGV